MTDGHGFMISVHRFTVSEKEKLSSLINIFIWEKKVGSQHKQAGGGIVQWVFKFKLKHIKKKTLLHDAQVHKALCLTEANLININWMNR